MTHYIHLAITMRRRRIRTKSPRAQRLVAGTGLTTIRRALQRVRRMIRNTRKRVSYAGVQVMTMDLTFGTTLASIVGPRRKCPRRCHAGKPTYARRHLRRRRAGLTYVHHHNRRRTDCWTVRLVIARTLCRRLDAPQECVPTAKGCISTRTASQTFKRWFVHTKFTISRLRPFVPSYVLDYIFPRTWF